MDDDFGFDSSVWASASSSSPQPRQQRTDPPLFPSASAVNSLTEDAFEDDDFDASMQSSGVDDDDFEDFGDFGDGAEPAGDLSFSQSPTFTAGFVQEPILHDDWLPLRLDPMPSSSLLRERVDELSDPVWGGMDSSQFTTNEDIRQVGGLSQVLVTTESRSLYNALFQYPPSNDNPPNWIRSRIRRRHLVSLGIPVNLDEVLPHVNGRHMSTLHVSTRPSSAPPGPRLNARNRTASPPPASASNSRAGTPKPGSSPLARTPTATQPGLGPKPGVDDGRIKQLLALTPESLTLLPLATLEKHLNTIRTLTADTSSLLTYLLQQRDALNQDSETYNGLIAELVGEAQKMKPGSKAKTRTGSLRRTSGMS